MHKLKQNIENLFGKEGKVWLEKLPSIIEILCSYWNLTELIPVDNMSYNYVAKATHPTHQAVVLKISCDEKSIINEAQALKYFVGRASVQLIDYNKQYNALLLQQAVPGTTLKSLYPKHVELVIDCYADTLQKLHSNPLKPNKNSFPHISDWLQAIDKANSKQIPQYLLDKAIKLKNKLLSSLEQEIVLHGDLHHENILKNNKNWLAIDPKGVIGELAFEAAAFDFIDESELKNQQAVKELFTTRAELLARKSHLNPQRLIDWVLVRLILSAAWSIEDNDDPTKAITLASLYYN